MDLVLDAARLANIELLGHSFSDSDYADDVALVDHSLQSLTSSLTRLQAEASRFGLNINWSKTKIQNIGYGPPPDVSQLNIQNVEIVSQFTYLGCCIESNASSHSEIIRRIALAASVFHRLSSVWKQENLLLSLKLRLYSSLVLSVLLYASETWTILAADLRRLEAFHMQCQRRILGIHWYDLISNVEVSSRTSLQSISDIICKRRLTFFGHVVRLAPSVPAHSALMLSADVFLGHNFPPGWSRPRGRPCKSWFQLVREDLSVPLEDALAAASDRQMWREVVMESISSPPAQ